VASAGALFREDGEVTCFVPNAISSKNYSTFVYPKSFFSFVMFDMAERFDFAEIDRFASSFF